MIIKTCSGPNNNNPKKNNRDLAGSLLGPFFLKIKSEQAVNIM